MKKFKLVTLVLLAGAILSGCANRDVLLKNRAALQQGKTYFQQQNYSAAYKYLYPLAVKGDKDSQYAVGYILYYGKIGDADKTRGTDFINAAAQRGYPAAEQAMRIIYSRN